VVVGSDTTRGPSDASAPWIQELGLAERTAPQFFRDPSEFSQDEGASASIPAIRRAWTALDLDGVLCLSGSPLVYFKEFSSHDPVALMKLHEAAWNNGLAPLVVAITPREVRVYSTLALPTKHPDKLDAPSRLARLFDRVLDGLELLRLTRDVELGNFFQTHQTAFDVGKRVDAYLLENLDATRRELVALGGLDTWQVHALLGRIVFTCYLVDRGIITGAYFTAAGAPGASSLLSLLDALSPGVDSCTLMYSLFRRLRLDFNGDIFGAALEAEEACVTSEHMDVLRRFLRGERLSNGQLFLGFWAYDFRVIPIETISAIYEQALEAEGEMAPGQDGADYRRKKGAFYTPRHLAQLVLEVALEPFQGRLLGRHVLDPACGSGIFLVSAFNRMAEEWQRANPNASQHKRFASLAGILTENICGVDESRAACGVAALSLYLSLLDRIAPRDIQDLQRTGRILPPLVYDPARESCVGRTILVGNFFNEESLSGARFDLVIGNPPWAVASGDDPMVAWCRARDLPLAQNQLADGFIWKSCEHIAESGHAALVLPASTLFNSQDKALRFIQRWLTHTSVEKILNLSDMSSFLFTDARRPAIIAVFNPNKPNLRTHRILYATPKTRPEMLFAEVLSVALDDCVNVRLADALPRESVGHRRSRWVSMLMPAPVWKRRMWGTSRDVKFLDRLIDFPPLFSNEPEAIASKWSLREGFNRHGKGKPLPRKSLLELPYLHTPQSYILSKGSFKDGPGFNVVNHCPPESVFRGPRVVFPHGVSRNGDRLKAAFSNKDFTFNHSIRSINGRECDEALLRFIACVLCSPLALYYFFHTAGNWGTERAKIHATEHASFPFPLPDSEIRKSIIEVAATIHRALDCDNKDEISPQQLELNAKTLDALVYKYFDVDKWEQALIEDTVEISIPSATPNRRRRVASTSTIPSLMQSTASERRLYRCWLSEALNQWTPGSAWRFQCNGTTAAGAGVGIASLGRVDAGSEHKRADSAPPESNVSADFDKTLKRIRDLVDGNNSNLANARVLKVFDQAELHIVKPLSRGYWTRTAALNDADEIAAAILGTRTETNL